MRVTLCQTEMGTFVFPVLFVCRPRAIVYLRMGRDGEGMGGQTGGGGAGAPPRHQISELISAKYFQFEIQTVI